MEKNALNQFGKNIKKRLIDLDINQSQLIQMVTGGIGIYSTFVHVDVREKKARWKG